MTQTNTIRTIDEYNEHYFDKGGNVPPCIKNILISGPTGSGKTEIARRIAKLTNAPFIRVEATKFT